MKNLEDADLARRAGVQDDYLKRCPLQKVAARERTEFKGPSGAVERIRVGSVHICDRGRRRTCSTPSCGRAAGKLCDFPVVRKGKAGTCDAALCDRCARPGARPGEDYCKPHALKAPLPDHVVNDADDCVSWCPGCRARKFAGLPPDGPNEGPRPASPPALPEAIAPPVGLPSPEDDARLKSLLANGVPRDVALEILGVE